MSYSQYSREKYMVQTTVAGTIYLDYDRALYIGMKQYLPTETVYTVDGKFEGYPELISFHFYDTVDLWWVICLYNGIIDPINEIVPGLNLNIPSHSSIDAYLSTLSPSNIGRIIQV